LNSIIFAISGFFGIVMKWCYLAVRSYGLSIIVFTVFTKLVLFPISLITQKNSIKMAQMRPELDALKTKYVDDKDKYADEQLALYKRMKYHPLLDMIPLLCQIVIVLGLVGVMYRPLTYILGVGSHEISVMKGWLDSLGITNLGDSYQLEIIRKIQTGDSSIAGVMQSTIDSVNGFDMHFMGLNLSERPSLHSNYILLIIPFLSGVSAWLMCVVQNRINVLQLYAGRLNKIGMTVFMIAFSTYFAFLVPSGVGVYWICGNLFAIPSMYLTNLVIPPKKYIDMDYVRIVNETAKQKEKYQRQYGRIERKYYKQFEHTEGKRLVFYSEGKGFYKYYAPIIDYLIEKSEYIIDYVTSDPEDPILDDSTGRIRPYYVAQDKYLIPLFMKLDCDICVMTMPDLEKYHIKRSKVRDDIEYIYVFHGMGSSALTLRKGALDNYDTLFCVGEDSVIEIRQMEELYGTRRKTLVETGYVLLDQMITEYNEDKSNNDKTVLIAPSWQPDNIIDVCIEKMLDILADTKYKVVVRPHPQQVRHEKQRFEEMVEKYKIYENIEIQTDFSSNFTVMNADLIITDWSDIAFEYAFTTLKPVLFIDTPMKVMNSDYDKIEIKPINIALRNVIGESLAVEDIGELNAVISRLIADRDKYHDIIKKTRAEHIFNIGKSKILSGKYIMKVLHFREN
jgi:YidC/Oxa1 family membrane protein insertase